jgi:hypothetical protein
MRQELPFEPLLVFSAASFVYVFNVKTRKIIGTLRGHGGVSLSSSYTHIFSISDIMNHHQQITAIAVHPIHPYLFCSTSRDFTTRIYDLLLEPRQVPNNPHWPPGTGPSLAGAAHGLHMTEHEGEGMGRCVAVLSGGRSGGHLAAVLGAVSCIASVAFFLCVLTHSDRHFIRINLYWPHAGLVIPLVPERCILYHISPGGSRGENLAVATSRWRHSGSRRQTAFQ